MVFFVLKPCTGELIKFLKREHYDLVVKDELDFNKVKGKLNIEIIDLKNVMSIYASFRGEFIKKNQHCIEMCFFNEQIVYFACYDSNQVNQWLEHITKAKKFFDWFTQIQDLLK